MRRGDARGADRWERFASALEAIDAVAVRGGWDAALRVVAGSARDLSGACAAVCVLRSPRGWIGDPVGDEAGDGVAGDGCEVEGATDDGAPLADGTGATLAGDAQPFDAAGQLRSDDGRLDPAEGAARRRRTGFACCAEGFARGVGDSMAYALDCMVDPSPRDAEASPCAAIAGEPVPLDEIGEFRGTLLLALLERHGFQSMSLFRLGGTAHGCEGRLALLYRTAPLPDDEDCREGRRAVRALASHAALRIGAAELAAERSVLQPRAKAILDATAAATLVTDGARTIVAANTAAHRLLGYPCGALVGVSVDGVLPGASTAPRREGVLLQTVEAAHRAGGVVRCECAATDISSGLGMVLVLQDVSDRAVVEERIRAADRLAMLGSLSRGLGHDINNMLFPIRAHLNALEAAKPGDPHASRQRHIGEIRGSVAYLQHLADALHFLAHEPDPPEDMGAQTELAHWWQQCGRLLAKALPRGVGLEVDLPEELPPVALSPHGLCRAVLNLLVNAREALAAAGEGRAPSVRLAAKVSRDGGQVHVEVSDNGIGMPEAVRRRATDMFFTTKPRALGTGLGLAVVRSTVERAGGRLEIRSAEGRGTEVRMLLPVRRDAGGDLLGTVRVVGLDGRTRAFLVPVLESHGLEVFGDGREEPAALVPRIDAQDIPAERADGAASATMCAPARGPDIGLADGAPWPDALVLGAHRAAPDSVARWLRHRPGSALLVVGPLPAAHAVELSARGVGMVMDPGDLGALERAVARLAGLEEGNTP